MILKLNPIKFMMNKFRILIYQIKKLDAVKFNN